MARSFNSQKALESAKPAVRRLQLVVLFLLIAITVAADQTVTVRGEIADAFCFAARGIRGPTHTACALRCARKGSPLVLVEEGTRRVYVLLPPKDESPMPEKVIQSAGTVRTVTGRAFMNAGTRFITVDKIE